jgi:chemotaxis protein MotB
MAAGSRRRKQHGHGAHNDERWLLTYSDMITLLMALFIILWAISTVNDAKFNELSKSLSEAFSGNLLPKERSILDGAKAKGKIDPIQPAEATARVSTARKQAADAAERLREQESLEALKRKLDAYVGEQGLSGKIETSIDERGLIIRILPDDVLFATGEAELKQGAVPILARIGSILNGLEADNPIRVEGNTDNVPISTPRFRNNWELSAARAVTVLTALVEDGIDPKRLSAAGYADQRPVTSNASPEGRALNRRVEIVMTRRAGAPAEATEAPAGGGAQSEGPLVDIQGEVFEPIQTARVTP